MPARVFTSRLNLRAAVVPTLASGVLAVAVLAASAAWGVAAEAGDLSVSRSLTTDTLITEVGTAAEIPPVDQNGPESGDDQGSLQDFSQTGGYIFSDAMAY